MKARESFTPEELWKAIDWRLRAGIGVWFIDREVKAVRRVMDNSRVQVLLQPHEWWIVHKPTEVEFEVVGSES